ncbi:MAG TPA: hypothetical protein VJ696_08815 [Rhodanobacteraceae bacterium]|nr:hypothetical protein [Rhodanobacteraceae bacterium]
MRLIRLLLVASSLSLPGVASPASAGVGVYFVGADAACPFHTIQDAVDAAAAHPGADFVWLAMNQSYSGEHVRISDTERLVVEGGFVDCLDNDVGTDLTVVSGAGNDGGAVFEIHGSASSDIYFKNVFITGADRDGDANGGGIDFYGAGKLTLEESSVSINSSGYGGGINVNGSEGPAELDLMHDVLVINNTAQTSGGGIRIDGDTRMFALAPRTLIELNHADGGYGGGLQVIGPARADIGSPGYGGLGVIASNQAAYGGGIAINDSENNDSAHVRLFATDPSTPVKIEQNVATATGGGVYLKPHSNFGFSPNNRAVLCAYDFLIDDNTAVEGAAIYADTDVYGSTVALNTSPAVTSLDTHDCDLPEPPAALGAVPCAQGIACNRIEGNAAEHLDGTPTDGSAILIQSEGALYADRFDMRGNTGGHAIRFVDDASDAMARVEMRDCLIATNVASAELIHAGPDGSTSGGTALVISRCTIANNAIGTPYVIHSAANFFEISNSIVDQIGLDIVDYAGPAGDMTAHDVLGTDVGTLAGGTDLVDGAPSYVDAASGDYHLERTSLGVDFAPADGSVDRDGNPRAIDLIDIGNMFGPMDVGAYEIQTQITSCAVADTVFCDGFDE